MAKSNREQRLQKIVTRRGRTPLVTTHTVKYVEQTRRSKAGVVHKYYQPVVTAK